MSFVGELFVGRLGRHAATLPFSLEGTFPSLTSFSSCEVVTAEIDWTAGIFVWVRLPNGTFHPNERSSILVLAPNRKCCRPLWCAGFPNRQLYSSSWVVLRWALVRMPPMTGVYNCRHAELDFVGLQSSLLRVWR